MGLLRAVVALAASAAALTTPYQRLKGVSLARATTGSPVELTSLWRPDFVGLGGERVVVEFLRHYG
jgi:hypothetical protein